MVKAAHEWDTCAMCAHTIQIHTDQGTVGECKAYKCNCNRFVLKTSRLA